MRVLHFSDIHLPNPLRQVPLRAWLGKRIAGGLNVLLHRGRTFRAAHQKLEALVRLSKEQEVDAVLFSGDYTMLGTNGELAAARRAVAPLFEAPLGYVHVPGNHDLYARDTVRNRYFERQFQDLHHSDLPEHLTDSSPWPLVRFLGAQVAVVAINSARVCSQPWFANGRIAEAQLQALPRILADPRVRERFIFVMIHHAPRLAGGKHDRRVHGLKNSDELLRICSSIERGAILCGHVHRTYRVPRPVCPVTIFCAGSATRKGREGFWIFDFDGGAGKAIPGRWYRDRYLLAPEAAVEL